MSDPLTILAGIGHVLGYANAQPAASMLSQPVENYESHAPAQCGPQPLNPAECSAGTAQYSIDVQGNCRWFFMGCQK